MRSFPRAAHRGLLQSPLRSGLRRPSTGWQERPPRPGLANGVPGAGARARAPASAPPRPPPPPAAAAAGPAAGAGTEQRSSASSSSPQPGRPPPRFCTATAGAGLPFFSASRGSGGRSVRRPRASPRHAAGTVRRPRRKPAVGASPPPGLSRVVLSRVSFTL